jgi:hypothetical protein
MSGFFNPEIRTSRVHNHSPDDLASHSKKADGLARKKFRTWLKKSQRGDAASTLGRSQIFTPFEN